MSRDIFLEGFRRFGCLTFGLINFRQPGIEMLGGILLFESLFPDLGCTLRIIPQVIDVTPRHPALGGKRLAIKRLLVSGICLRILFCMVISMSRQFIQVRPPGDALRCLLIMPCRLSIRSGSRGFFQFGIAGDR